MKNSGKLQLTFDHVASTGDDLSWGIIQGGAETAGGDIPYAFRITTGWKLDIWKTPWVSGNHKIIGISKFLNSSSDGFYAINNYDGGLSFW